MFACKDACILIMHAFYKIPSTPTHAHEVHPLALHKAPAVEHATESPGPRECQLAFLPVVGPHVGVEEGVPLDVVVDHGAHEEQQVEGKTEPEIIEHAAHFQDPHHLQVERKRASSAHQRRNGEARK